MNPLRQLFSELRRRGVFKTAGLYLAAGWLTIQVMDVSQTPMGIPGWVLSLAIWLVVVGFPFALAFSWRYDVGLDGITRTPPSDDPSEDDLRIRGSDLVLLALGVTGVAALSWILGDWIMERQAETAAPVTVAISEDSIAVLPFENLGGDEQNYLGRGLAEDILHRLAAIDQLSVTSRTSSFELDTADMDMAAIGARLGARHVLEGSVRRSGDRVRIVAQLIEAQTDEHVWSKSYDRDIEDLFAIYDEISLAIVAELQLTLAPGTGLVLAPPTSDMQAYDYYLQARSILQRATDVDAVTNALVFFGRAVEQDDRFATAWAGQCSAWLASHEFEPLPNKVEQARQSCETALALDPQLADALVADGELLRSTGEPERAVRQFEAAIQANPDLGIAWRGLGQAQEALGDAMRAETALLQAVDTDPDDLMNLYALGDFYFYQGRYEQASPVYEALANHPRASASAFNTLGASRSMMGDFEGAADAFRRVIAIEPTDIAYANVGVIYYLLGRFDEGRAMLEEAITLAPDDPFHWTNLGDVRRQLPNGAVDAQNAYRRAAEIGEQLLAINDRDLELMTNQAHALSRLGDDPAALTMIEAVLAEDPSDPYAYYYAALIHLEAGRNAAAIEAIAESLSLNYPLPQLLADPQFALLQQDPAYAELIQSHR